MTYSYQSVDHESSISAERYAEDKDMVVVEIVIGESAEMRIVMWAEDFAKMISATCN